MPEITNEKDESKIDKKSTVKNSAKSADKKTIKKSTTKSSTKITVKNTDKSPKKAATKKSEKKATKTPKQDADIKEKKRNEVIREETVIEKIKSFLAKIIAMQEEARKESEKNVEEKEIDAKKEIKTVVKKDTSYMSEYYDLPYRYNETVVKILAQTPKKLFVYWDISDNDRQKYLKAFGERFFDETYPVLLVHNADKNYTFEITINDFANSWYLDIKDPKTKYVIELGRKFKTKPGIVNIATTDETKDVVLKNDYVPITVSNTLEVPNDHILFENIQTKALYRNVKNNAETHIDIKENKYTEGMGHIYNIYDIYKEIYKNEISADGSFDLLNPSSMTSSSFK